MTDRKLTISEMWLNLKASDNYWADMRLSKRDDFQKEK